MGPLPLGVDGLAVPHVSHALRPDLPGPFERFAAAGGCPMLVGGKAARTAGEHPSQIPADWIDTENRRDEPRSVCSAMLT